MTLARPAFGGSLERLEGLRRRHARRARSGSCSASRTAAFETAAEAAGSRTATRADTSPPAPSPRSSARISMAPRWTTPSTPPTSSLRALRRPRGDVRGARAGAPRSRREDEPKPEDDRVARRGMGGRGGARHAVYVRARHPDVPACSTPALAVNHSGDSDSTGAIAGNILGALHGETALPPDLVSSSRVAATILQLADDLVLEMTSGGRLHSEEPARHAVDPALSGRLTPRCISHARRDSCRDTIPDPRSTHGTSRPRQLGRRVVRSRTRRRDGPSPSSRSAGWRSGRR